MSEANGQHLPPGWVQAPLPAIAQLNPPLDRCIINDTVQVDFVPMRAVEPEGGGLLRAEVATYGEVKKGYTPFLSGNVIMAKITPCMENGKTCVVPPLPGAACFGSTEFHVVRAESGIEARWIANYLLQHSTRHDAQRQMMGGVGQMRVPAGFLEALQLPVPPAQEQCRILENTDELLSDLDAAMVALKRAQAKLKHYRAAVLKAAVEGSITAEWRATHPTTEPATALLTRVLAERRRRWEGTQLKKFKESGKAPPKDWKTRYKEPPPPSTHRLPTLPGGWSWASADQLCFQINDGEHIQPPYKPVGLPMLTAKNVRNGFVDFGNIGFISESDFDACLKRCAPAEHDVLIVSVGATTGRAAIVGACEPFAIVRSVLLLKPIFAPRFLLRWIQSPWCQTYIRRASGSSAQAHLYIADTKNIPVPLPPLLEQEAIIECVDDQISVIDHLESDLEAKLNSAQTLCQSILRHAFTGQLVPQDPEDDPASKLLERIAADRAERQRLVATPIKVGRALRARRTHSPRSSVVLPRRLNSEPSVPKR